MTVWFNDPYSLFRTTDILKFWPTSSQTPDERVNASTRFVLYLTSILYLIKRDPRVWYLALMVLAVLFILYKSNIISQSSDGMADYSDGLHSDCQLPSVENPMANVMMGDYTEDPQRPPACFYPTVKPVVKEFLDNTIPYDAGRSRSSLPKYQQQFAARQFVSNPSTTIPNNQTDFAEWCYGKKNRPMCRDDPSVCNPNARGAQLEAFAGLDPSGDMRTGMFGGNRGRSASTHASLS